MPWNHHHLPHLMIVPFTYPFIQLLQPLPCQLHLLSEHMWCCRNCPSHIACAPQHFVNELWNTVYDGIELSVFLVSWLNNHLQLTCTYFDFLKEKCYFWSAFLCSMIVFSTLICWSFNPLSISPSNSSYPTAALLDALFQSLLSRHWLFLFDFCNS